MIVITIILLLSLSLQGQDCYVDTIHVKHEGRKRVYVPDHIVVRVHFISYTDGQFTSIGDNDVEGMLLFLNDSYETITFLDGGITYDSDTSLYDLNYNLERDGIVKNDKRGFYLNLHVVGTLKINDLNFAGVALYPDAGKLFCIIGHNYKYSSTLPHEVGHTFYLYHTFEWYNWEEFAETVDGFECDIRGDKVCDTRADHPNLLYSLCTIPSNTILDFNGDTLYGEPENVMSYNSKLCRDVITEGQEYRARYNIAKYFGDGIPVGVYENRINDELLPLYEVGGIIGNKKK